MTPPDPTPRGGRKVLQSTVLFARSMWTDSATCPRDDWWMHAQKSVALGLSAPTNRSCMVAQAQPPWAALHPLMNQTFAIPRRHATSWTQALPSRPWEIWLALHAIFHHWLGNSTLLVGPAQESAWILRCHYVRQHRGMQLRHVQSLEAHTPSHHSLVILLDTIAGSSMKPWQTVGQLPQWVAPGGAVILLSRTLLLGTRDAGIVPMPAALPAMLEMSGLQCKRTYGGDWGNPTIVQHILRSCQEHVCSVGAAPTKRKTLHTLFKPASWLKNQKTQECTRLWPVLAWVLADDCTIVQPASVEHRITDTQKQLADRAKAASTVHGIWMQHQSDSSPGNLPMANLSAGNISSKATRRSTELQIMVELRRRVHPAGRVLFISGDWPMLRNLRGSTQMTVANYPAVKCERLPYRDSSFDTYMANMVFEHVTMPWKCMEEAFRVLAPHGLLVVASPAFYQQHGWPSDFWRFASANAFIDIAAPFTDIVTGTWGNFPFINYTLHFPTHRRSKEMSRAALQPNDPSHPFTNWIVASASKPEVGPS